MVMTLKELIEHMEQVAQEASEYLERIDTSEPSM